MRHVIIIYGPSAYGGRDVFLNPGKLCIYFRGHSRWIPQHLNLDHYYKE